MDRAKRVRRLKKMIIAVLITAILIPILLCVFLLVRVSALEDRLDQLLMKRQETTAAQEQVQMVSRMAGQGILEKRAAAEILEMEQEALAAQKPQEQAAAHKIYLTFDDGPSRYTAEILDILKEYDIKATFFVVGREDENSLAMYRRIVAEGHTLGMHSYSHKYSEIYASREAFIADMTKLSDLLYSTTGVRPKICRFPGGSSNQVSRVDMQELFDWLAEKGIQYYDWNISSGDAVASGLATQTIIQNCTKGLERYGSAMILMHDAAEKHTTVEALPVIIEYGMKMEDTVFLPITEETTLIQHK